MIDGDSEKAGSVMTNPKVLIHCNRVSAGGSHLATNGRHYFHSQTTNCSRFPNGIGAAIAVVAKPVGMSPNDERDSAPLDVLSRQSAHFSVAEHVTAVDVKFTKFGRHHHVRLEVAEEATVNATHSIASSNSGVASIDRKRREAQQKFRTAIDPTGIVVAAAQQCLRSLKTFIVPTKLRALLRYSLSVNKALARRTLLTCCTTQVLGLLGRLRLSMLVGVAEISKFSGVNGLAMEKDMAFRSSIGRDVLAT